MNYWYVQSAGSEAVGPVSTELVLKGITAGRIPLDAKVCGVGAATWQDIVSVPEFSETVRAAVPPPPFATIGQYAAPQTAPNSPWQVSSPQNVAKISNTKAPSTNTFAIVSFVLALWSLIFGPITGIAAIVLASKAVNQINAAPQNYRGGPALAVVAGAIGAVFSVLWGAIGVRAFVISSPLTAGVSVALGVVLCLAALGTEFLPQARALANRRNTVVLIATAFVLVAPGGHYFVSRNLESRRCDDLVDDVVTFASGPSMSGNLSIEQAQQGITKVDRLLNDAEAACKGAGRTERLNAINVARESVDKIRSKVQAASSAAAASAAASAKEQRAANMLSLVRNQVQEATGKARQGEWDEVERVLVLAESNLALCSGLVSPKEISQSKEDIQALRKIYKRQLEASALQRQKAAASRPTRPSGGDGEDSEIEAKIRGSKTEAELMVPVYIRDNMKDPSSYEYVSGVGSGRPMKTFWVINWTWRGTNSYGAVVQNSEQFCVSAGEWVQRVFPCR